jgi:hypothetical protein
MPVKHSHHNSGTSVVASADAGNGRRSGRLYYYRRGTSRPAATCQK